MNANIGSLFQLEEQLDAEVRGREAVAPPADVILALNNLLAGKCSSAGEKKRALELLRGKPDWLAWFAGQIKARRAKSAAD